MPSETDGHDDVSRRRMEGVPPLLVEVYRDTRSGRYIAAVTRAPGFFRDDPRAEPVDTIDLGQVLAEGEAASIAASARLGAAVRRGPMALRGPIAEAALESSRGSSAAEQWWYASRSVALELVPALNVDAP